MGFFSEECQPPSSVSGLALLFGRAEKLLPPLSSHASCSSSSDTATTKPFLKKAVPASTKKSVHTNEDNAIGADLLLSLRLLFKGILLTVGIIK